MSIGGSQLRPDASAFASLSRSRLSPGADSSFTEWNRPAAQEPATTPNMATGLPPMAHYIQKLFGGLF